jgi:hypothetical protein
MGTIVDFMTLASAAFLAVPAWHFNHYARLSSRATLHKASISDPVIAERHTQVQSELQKLRDNWKHWKAWCLHAGTALGLGAAVLAAIEGLTGPACGC